MPSVLWHCWLGSRNDIWPVKYEWWGAGMVISLGRSANVHMVQLMPLPLTVSCSIKSKLVSPFWNQLTRVDPDKGPLNGCYCCCCLCDCAIIITDLLSYQHNLRSLNLQRCGTDAHFSWYLPLAYQCPLPNEGHWTWQHCSVHIGDGMFCLFTPLWVHVSKYIFKINIKVNSTVTLTIENWSKLINY